MSLEAALVEHNRRTYDKARAGEIDPKNSPEKQLHHRTIADKILAKFPMLDPARALSIGNLTIGAAGGGAVPALVDNMSNLGIGNPTFANYF